MTSIHHPDPGEQVASSSAIVARERPFYGRCADAYDLLVTDPVEPWASAVHGWLARAALPDTSILDAGCGTGRHARAMIDLGHDVTLLDASPALLAIACRRCPEAPPVLGDLCAPDLRGPFGAVTCRGVLNDLLSNDERAAALRSFARLLEPAGWLFLDVRAASASRARADGVEHRREVRSDDGGSLTFGHRSVWRDGLLRVVERYELRRPDQEPEFSDYVFHMRPWPDDELRERLGSAGFEEIHLLPGVGRRTPDRRFVVARLHG